jgi:hypothetical protein
MPGAYARPVTRDPAEVTEALRDAAVRVTPATDPMTVSEGGPFPVGRGTLEGQPLTNPTGDHALLLRQAGTPRALVLAEPGAVTETGRERVVIMPFDEDVEIRVDGDALATWIATPYDAQTDDGGARVPAWASAFGFVLIIVVVVLTVVGGAVVFTWILDALG